VVFFVFLLYLGTVPTVWYFSIVFWNCSDNGIFCFVFYGIIDALLCINFIMLLIVHLQSICYLYYLYVYK
jgi:hypothetical protein